MIMDRNERARNPLGAGRKQMLLNLMLMKPPQQSYRMDVQKLYWIFKKIQEAKGSYFNKDRERVFELLDALLVNKKRYGYMSCPCRLASGDRKTDQNIICPCVYREPDVNELGSCYCNLYVSKD